MKSLTPEQTARHLGWKAARESLRKAKTFGAPKPARLPRMRWHWFFHFGTMRVFVPLFFRGCIDWCKWPWRCVQFYRNLYKQSKVPFVAEYKKLAEVGTPSREAFKQCKVKMHLTEDEIFQQGNRILRGENLPALERPKDIDVGKQISWTPNS